MLFPRNALPSGPQALLFKEKEKGKRGESRNSLWTAPSFCNKIPQKEYQGSWTGLFRTEGVRKTRNPFS
jgi:hypothetical protein